MHLKQYLELHGLTKSAFAEKAGLHHTTITLALRQQGSERTLRAIFDATDGAVTPNDVLGVGPANGVRDTGASLLGRVGRALGFR